MTTMIRHYTPHHWIVGFITRLWSPRLFKAMKSRYIAAGYHRTTIRILY